MSYRYMQLATANGCQATKCYRITAIVVVAAAAIAAVAAACTRNIGCFAPKNGIE